HPFAPAYPAPVSWRLPDPARPELRLAARNLPARSIETANRRGWLPSKYRRRLPWALKGIRRRSFRVRKRPDRKTVARHQARRRAEWLEIAIQMARAPAADRQCADAASANVRESDQDRAPDRDKRVAGGDRYGRFPACRRCDGRAPGSETD